MKRLFGALILVFLAQASPGAESKMELLGGEYEFGGIIQVMIPSRLPDLDVKFSAYGPRVGIPLGKDTLQIQALYGSAGLTEAYLGDVYYRLNVQTPVFTNYFLLGGHLLHYRTPAVNRTKPGVTTGMGLDFRVTNSFTAQAEMKIYFQARMILAFGGALAFLL